MIHPETAFTFVSNPSDSFQNICSEIREKIEILDDNNFEDFEQDMYNLSVVFYNMWSPYINFEENRMYDTIDKKRFVKEIRLLYNTFYLVYGNKKMMDDIQQMLHEEPDSINEVNEYLQFVEDVRSFENYSEDDIDNPDSIYTEKINKIKYYISKKQTELEELKDAMSNLNNSLKNLASKLEIMNIQKK